MSGVKLTPRMLQVANLVPEGAAVADVGCDHAYVSIYLCTERHCNKVLAMDVKKGPLEIAARNIAEASLADRIELRLSDGLEKVEPGEIDTVVLAGMGGLLMVEILKKRESVVAEVDVLVLQPQSDISAVRRFVHEIGFVIQEEAMVWDDEKPYFMMQCRRGMEAQWTAVEYAYGKGLLVTKNTGLYTYLQKEKRTQAQIVEHLSRENSARTTERLRELRQLMELNEKALAYFD